ncbi:MAG: hypothetical protein O2897_03855, partial [bacterium]|nr:hypothetical protein [bacterium]
ELAIHAVDFAKIDEKQKLPRIIFTLGNNSILNLTKLNNWVKNNSQKIILTEKMKLIYTASLEEWQTMCNQDIFIMIKHVINQIKVQVI